MKNTLQRSFLFFILMFLALSPVWVFALGESNNDQDEGSGEIISNEIDEDEADEEEEETLVIKDEVDTSTIFEMPAFESDNPIDLYRPVKMRDDQKISIPRPLTISNYYNNYKLTFKKGTRIMDKNSKATGSTVKPPRKTLPSVAKIEIPEEEMLYPFFIVVGNSCYDQAEDCRADHFAPKVNFTMPLPITVSKDNFEIRFYDSENKIWHKHDFTFHDENELIELDLSKAGLLAIVDKKNKRITRAKYGDENMMSVPIPNGIDKNNFQLRHYSKREKRWILLDYKIDSQTGHVIFNSEDVGFLAFIPDDKNTYPEKLSNSQKREDFLDVWPSDWFYTDVYDLYDRKIIKPGQGNLFRPHVNVNRAEAAKMLKNAFLLPVSDEINLSDIDESTWFARYAQTGIDYGIFNPYLNNSFQPDANLSRAEALMTILRASGINISDEDAALAQNEFNDVNSSDEFAKYAGYALRFEIINTNKENLRPYQNVTRAEFFKMLNRTLKVRDVISTDELLELKNVRLAEKIRFSQEDLTNFEKNFINWESDKDIERLKKILYYLGYFKGKIDQNFDSSLESALKEFQIANGVFVNDKELGAGRFTEATRIKINEILPTIKMEAGF